MGKFSKAFWVANSVELLERLAYYAVFICDYFISVECVGILRCGSRGYFRYFLSFSLSFTHFCRCLCR